jgi:hypothetical protein
MFNKKKYMKEYRQSLKYKNYIKQHRKTKQYKEWEKDYRRHRKQEIINHYGGQCDCCGEKHIEFLCIDHIYGGGNKHRRELKISSGEKFYRWIVKNNYPDGFRVLCLHCNFSLGAYGYCPHQEEKKNGKSRIR